VSQLVTLVTTVLRTVEISIFTKLFVLNQGDYAAEPVKRTSGKGESTVFVSAQIQTNDGSTVQRQFNRLKPSGNFT
jgi:hypothetical protein